MSDQVFIGCDNLVSWLEPEDALDGSSIGEDATGLVTVYEDDKTTPVTGAVDLTVYYTAGPPKRYYATIPNTVDFTEGETYYVQMTLTPSGGTPHGTRMKEVTAAYAD